MSAEAKMSKGFANFLSQQNSGLRDACRRTSLSTRQIFPFWDETGNRCIYKLVTKIKYFEKPILPILSLALEAMKSHARLYGISTIAIPKSNVDLIKCTGKRL